MRCLDAGERGVDRLAEGEEDGDHEGCIYIYIYIYIHIIHKHINLSLSIYIYISLSLYIYIYIWTHTIHNTQPYHQLMIWYLYYNISYAYNIHKSPDAPRPWSPSSLHRREAEAKRTSKHTSEGSYAAPEIHEGYFP